MSDISLSNGVMSAGVRLIFEERMRQVTGERWTQEHDDTHEAGQLAIAGACYALEGIWVNVGGVNTNSLAFSAWPWDSDWWKPGKDRIRQLAKAGALIAAEIDRIIREDAKGAGNG